jgi:hypothetical protein
MGAGITVTVTPEDGRRPRRSSGTVTARRSASRAKKVILATNDGAPPVVLIANVRYKVQRSIQSTLRIPYSHRGTDEELFPEGQSDGGSFIA